MVQTMFRMLIVDDEPAIVNGLSSSFNKNTDMQLDIYTAISAEQAIEIAKDNRIDILISDINMPGMNGIKMTQNILFFWKNCKIIFLTAHSEFDYIYNATRTHKVRYILKSEEDVVIINAVKDIIDELNQENAQQLILIRANEHFKKISQILKKEFLEYIIFFKYIENGDLEKQFEDIEIDLDANLPVYITVCKIDETIDCNDYSLMQSRIYAVKDMFERTIESFITFEGIILENSKIVWFLQPEPSAERFLDNDGKFSFEKMVVFTKNSIESVQNSAQDVFAMSISFLLSGGMVAWQDVYIEYSMLKNVISKHFRNHAPMIIDLASGNSFYENNEKHLFSTLSSNRNILNEIERTLSNGDIEKIEQICGTIFQEINNNISSSYFKCAELYYRLLTNFVFYINNYGLTDKLTRDIDMQKLIFLGMPEELEKAQKFFIALGKYICLLNKEDSKKEEFLVIDKIENYVRENFGGNLSLVKLGELVYLNPSYLSRFYKQTTGRNIHDYINSVKLDKAKELLCNPKIKVHEVSASLGFDSVSYFSLFFKKMTGQKPQEYRNSLIDKRPL